MGYGPGYRNINFRKAREIFWNITSFGAGSPQESGPSAIAGDPISTADSSGLGLAELIGLDSANRHKIGNAITNIQRTPIQCLIQPNASEVTTPFFVNANVSAQPTLGNYSEAVQITRIDLIFGTTNGAALTGVITKDGAGQAPGAGPSIQVGSFNLNATANIVQNAVLPNGVGTGNPLIVVQPGEQLSLNLSAAVTSLAGLVVILWVKPFNAVAPATLALNAAAAQTTKTMYLNIVPGLTVASVSMRWSAAATGGTVTADVTKDTSTNAPGAGTSVLAAAQSLTGTANTTVFVPLTATAATLSMNGGDRLAFKLTGTPTSLAGLVITVTFAAGPEFIHVIQNPQYLNVGVDLDFFVADHFYAVEDFWGTWGTVSTSNTAQLTRDSGTTAPGAGTGLLTDNTNTGLLTSGTINTPVEGTLVADKTKLILQPGDRLGIHNAGTLGTLANACFAVRLRKL